MPETGNNNRGRMIGTTLVALILLVACGTLVLQKRSGRPGIIDNLAELPLQPVAGWERVDHNVAESPEVERAIRENLNFDQALFLEFRKGGDHIHLYLAYWRPGKYHPRLVAQHTPDVCWPGQGWVLRKKAATTVAATVGEPGPLLPAEFRIFDCGSVREYVHFWHLVGGRLSEYTPEDGAVTIEFWRSFWKQLFSPVEAQYFVRLSSNKPYAELREEPMWRRLLAELDPVLRGKVAQPR